MGTAQMRQSAESVGTRQVEVEKQQISVWMLLEGIKQAGNAIGLEELTVSAGCRDGALECRSEQRVIIDDEDFVVHAGAGLLFTGSGFWAIVIQDSTKCDTTEGSAMGQDIVAHAHVAAMTSHNVSVPPVLIIPCSIARMIRVCDFGRKSMICAAIGGRSLRLYDLSRMGR